MTSAADENSDGGSWQFHVDVGEVHLHLLPIACSMMLVMKKVVKKPE